MRDMERKDELWALVVNFCFKDKAAQVVGREALASSIPVFTTFIIECFCYPAF